jgi:ribosome-associated toxin RatA of RatAB toxin-antitoxin module
MREEHAMVLTHPHESVATAGGRSGARRFVLCAALVSAAVVTTSAGAPGREPDVRVDESEGVYTVSASFVVPQAPAVAFDVLTDYAAIPRFMPEVHVSHVLTRGQDRAVVEQEATAKFMMFSRRIHLVLDIEEGQDAIRFHDRCAKSFGQYEGSWTMVANGAATTITYELVAKPAFAVPEFLLKKLLKRDAARMIARLRTEIASRAPVLAQ